METRANHVLVGVVTLALLAALAAFIIWIARLGQGQQNEYDILFQQTVAGLANGSQVSFAGVPVGQVRKIELWKEDPEFVRVRISVEEDVPMLIGTTATIQASFTGVSTIMLDGARKDAPAITCETTACPEGAPLIPPTRGGFNEILASAPVLLERLATLTERLNEVLSDENQAEIKGILRNTNRVTESLARSGPQLEGAMAELEVTLREAGETLDAFEAVTKSTDRLLNQEGAALAQQLRVTLASANAAAASLSKTLEDTRPIARQLSESTLPNAEATLRDLRATSKALRNVTEKLENQGLGTLIEGQSLPDYEP